ncbi:MAG: hypothetical protein IJC16_08200 [Rikenellaceae bacterium]|nr:hypothetical protein [Rikenellaceae bacterium]
MNTYRSIDEALYEVADGTVIRKKRNLVIPAVVMVVGALIAAFSDRIDIFFPRVDLAAALMLSGGVLCITGLINLIVDATSKTGVPVFAETGEKLQRHQLFYDTHKKGELCNCFESGDFSKLSKIDKSSVSAVILTVYSTKSGSMAMAQVSEFVPHQFVPVTGIKMFRGEEGRQARGLVAEVA